MSLALQINRNDTRPVYLQIVAQIKKEISIGNLPPGTRLPPVRQVAQTLSVNRLTVHAAYSELQADGWIESTVGRGTFVLKTAQAASLLSSIGHQFSANSVLSDIHPINQIPTLRSMAYAEPDIDLAPIDEFMGGFKHHHNPAAMMHYDGPRGDSGLRVEVASLMRERGIEATPDEIMITTGAMQGLSLATQILTKPGDTVLIEEPTYLGMVHILDVHGLRPIPITYHADGYDLNMVEQAMKREKPRFFYTIPAFQNPSGRSLPYEKHRALLQLAAKYGVTIIEDDIYGLLSYDGAASPALKVQDLECNVIYISSISKVMMPGIRVGWMIVPPDMQEAFLAQRRAVDVCGPLFVQHALANFLSNGRLKMHLRRVLPVYRSRRDALMRAMQRHMPPGVTWSVPGGGFSCWVTLPQTNMSVIYQQALKNNIAFTPGDAFMFSADINRHFRLCYGHQTERDIDEIVSLLGELIGANTQ